MEQIITVQSRELEEYGDLPMIQSLTYNSLHFTKIADLTEADMKRKS